MRSEVRGSRPAALLSAAILCLLAGACGGSTTEGGVASPEPAPVDPEIRVEASDEDWRIARQKAEWAIRELEPAGHEFGDLVAAIGETFVGTRYVAGTLEVGPPERLVVELEGLDCVTFVETTLTLATLVRKSPEALGDEELFRRRFGEILTALRYRDGALDGYASRLHYFSEWIADNQTRGLVTDVTHELGGRLEEERIDFMSTHADAYPALADPATLDAIVEIETRLAKRPSYTLPQDEVGAAAEGIRNGDIIAATSTVSGLDIAHTGIAVWKDSELRLLHAPLVGKDVQLSGRPLSERLLAISSQDGIMVARPVDPGR